MSSVHASSIGFVLIAMIIFTEQRAPAQSTDSSHQAGGTGGSSPYTLVRSIESIGTDVLSLFGIDAKEEAAKVAGMGAGGGRPGRRKIKVYLSLESGVQSYVADQRSCQSGNGVCSFSISLSNSASATTPVVSAQASYFPRQKRIVLELDSPLDTQYRPENGKLLLVVRRSATDTTDTNGTIIVNNKRLYIRNGEYEVVNNTVSFYLD